MINRKLYVRVDWHLDNKYCIDISENRPKIRWQLSEKYVSMSNCELESTHYVIYNTFALICVE